MKKIISAGILFILTIGLGGCDWFQSEEPTVEGSEESTVEEPEGIVEETQIVAGNYYQTGFAGATLFFDPDDATIFQKSVDQYFSFSSNEEAYTLLEIEEDFRVSCPGDFYGEATVEIKNLEEKQGAYEEFWSAELVKVLETSVPVCDIYEN